jgi:hypothetical protein
VDSQREFRKSLGLPLLEVTRFEAPSCLIEAPSQRPLFVDISQLTQKLANPVCALMGGADDAQRVVRRNRSRQEALQQRTLEFTTTLRAFGVDVTAIILAQSNARLGNGCLCLQPPHRSAKGTQDSFIVAGPQLNVAEQNAIAAQAASQAEFAANGVRPPGCRGVHLRMDF